jgi:hypothetical protein
MRNTRLTSILSSALVACALMIGTLASPQVAPAQSSTPVAEVTIPFAFQTGSQTLPAGKYRIDLESNHLILLRGPGQTEGFVEMHDTTKTRPADHGYIVFDRYGSKYFLRQIWTAGDTTGLECSKSRAEKETLQANDNQSPTSTELAFNSVSQH